MKIDRSALSRAAQSLPRGPYDKYFEPNAALPQGAAISQKSGRIYLDDKDGTVLLSSRERDRMVHNKQQQWTPSIEKAQSAEFHLSQAYKRAYQDMAKDGILDASDRKKLASLGRDANIANWQMAVDGARLALGKYMKLAAGDSKLDRVEQDHIIALQEHLAGLEKSLKCLKREDRRLDRAGRKSSARPAPREDGPASTDLRDVPGAGQGRLAPGVRVAKPAGRPASSDTNGMIGDDGSA